MTVWQWIRSMKGMEYGRPDLRVPVSMRIK